MGAPIMQEQERLLIGRITRLQTFTVREFGTRASFRLNARKAQSPAASPGRLPAELVTHYRESDIVAVTGISEPRPSAASAMTAWAGRVRVRTLRVLQVIWAAAWCSTATSAMQLKQADPIIGRRRACARHYCSLLVKRENQALRHLVWWSEGCGMRFPKRAHRRRDCAVSV